MGRGPAHHSCSRPPPTGRRRRRKTITGHCAPSKLMALIASDCDQTGILSNITVLIASDCDQTGILSIITVLIASDCDQGGCMWWTVRGRSSTPSSRRPSEITRRSTTSSRRPRCATQAGCRVTRGPSTRPMRRHGRSSTDQALHWVAPKAFLDQNGPLCPRCERACEEMRGRQLLL